MLTALTFRWVLNKCPTNKLRYLRPFPAIPSLCQVHSINLTTIIAKAFLSNTLKECGITNIQDEGDFKNRVLNNQLPVLVDFHATWCGPCKLLGPRLESAMKSYMNKALLAKVDVDELDVVAAKYQVSAVPTVVVMKDGKVVDKFTGLKEEEYIVKILDKITRN